MKADQDQSAVAAWVQKVNALAAEIESYMQSISPSAWDGDEYLKAQNERFRKLAAGGPGKEGQE